MKVTKNSSTTHIGSTGKVVTTFTRNVFICLHDDYIGLPTR